MWAVETKTLARCRPTLIAVAVALAGASAPLGAFDAHAAAVSAAATTVATTTAAAQFPQAAGTATAGGLSQEIIALDRLIAEQRSERVAHQRLLERVMNQQSALSADLQASMHAARASQANAFLLSGAAVLGLAALFALLHTRSTRQLIAAGNQRMEALELRYDKRVTELRAEWRDELLGWREELQAWRAALPAAAPATTTTTASLGSVARAAPPLSTGLAGATPLPTDRPASLLVEESPEAAWQWLTAAPQQQYDLTPAPSHNSTLPPQSDLTFGAGGTQAGLAALGTNRSPGEVDVAASQRQTLDPALGHSGSGWPAGTRDAVARQRLASLELHDSLRQQLSADPELLRLLVQESLAVVIEPAKHRTLEDWRLLVIDAWRRDNLDEALARTDSMIECARTDNERITAHEHRALVLDRMQRLQLTPTPVIATPELSAPHVDESHDISVLDTMLREGVRLRREARDFDNAQRVFETLIQQLPAQRNDDHERLWLRATINLALVESTPGRSPRKAIERYHAIEAALGAVPDTELTAIRAASLAQARFNRAVLAYERLDDADTAIAGYATLVAAHRERSEPAVMLAVAHALSNHAWLLAHVRRDTAGAVALYRELDARFGTSTNPDMQVLVASGLFASAALSASGRRDVAAALTAYDTLERRFGTRADAPIGALVAKTLFNRAALLGSEAGRRAEAIDAYGRLLARATSFGDDVPQLGELVAASYVNRGVLLLRQGDSAMARRDFESAIARFGNDSIPRIVDQIARARFNLAGIDTEEGNVDAAIAHYLALLARELGNAEQRTLVMHARALSNLAFLYANPRRETQNALGVFTTLLEHFRHRPEAELAEQCARALVSIGVLKTTRTRDIAGAVAAYSELVERYVERDEPIIADRVAKGLFNLAALHAQQRNDVPATLASLTTLIDHYRHRSEPDIVTRVASGMLTKARILDRLRDDDAAAAAYRLLVQTFARHPDPQLAKYVAAARAALRGRNDMADIA